MMALYDHLLVLGLCCLSLLLISISVDMQTIPYDEAMRELHRKGL